MVGPGGQYPAGVTPVSSLNVAIAYLDSDQTYRFVTKRYEQIFGIQAADVLGRPLDVDPWVRVTGLVVTAFDLLDQGCGAIASCSSGKPWTRPAHGRRCGTATRTLRAILGGAVDGIISIRESAPSGSAIVLRIRDTAWAWTSRRGRGFSNRTSRPRVNGSQMYPADYDPRTKTEIPVSFR